MTDLSLIITVLDDTAQDLTQAQPCIGAWRGYVVYLFEALEAKAMDIDQGHPEPYEAMLNDLVTDIGLRLDHGISTSCCPNTWVRPV
jgi:hypothetical protein